jgi:hypothetical protein
MTLRSNVEDDVAHWILLVAFSLSIGFSLFAFSKLTSLEIVSADQDTFLQEAY